MVALVFCGDLKYCPYISRYIERLDKLNSEYCVLFWNRSGVTLDLPNNYFYYAKSSDLNNGKIQKMLDFIRFRKWVLGKIKDISPNKIIALSTLTGVLLGSKLYKNRVPYVFDIRDYSYEHIRLFYQIEKKVISHSHFTAISSKGFKEFLPVHDYVIAHNFNRNDIKNNAKFSRFEKPIRFVWNGVIRYFEYQKQYLDALKNDERFEIIFHGDGPQLELYKEYCQDNKFENVIFTGSYCNEEKADLLKDAGILNNCYGYVENAGNKLKYAVSNRFYDGMIYHIPQLVEPDGYKPRWAKQAKVGESFVVDQNFADRLYNYYININAEEFDLACDSIMKDVLCEDDEYIKRIDSFILC